MEFVKGLVPSAVVTQRHMGALSFNVQQLQVHDALYILQGSFMLCRVPCLPLRSVKCVCHLQPPRLLSHSLQLSDFFEAIEGSKAVLAISDYSISQTTLEQVFISFVKNS